MVNKYNINITKENNMEEKETTENSSISEMDDWIKTFDFKLPSLDESWRNNPPPESCLAPGIEIPF